MSMGTAPFNSCYTSSLMRRGAEVAREAHNLQVVGSNPTAATTKYFKPRQGQQIDGGA